MKYICFAFLLVISLAYCSNDAKTAAVTAKGLNESEAKVYANYAKWIYCAQKPIEKTCPECLSTKNGYKLFFFFQASRLNIYKYRFMIHYNDKSKKIIISFAGPSAKENPKYIHYIYSFGFSWVSTYRVQVEKEYKIAFYKYLRPILKQKIAKILKSGRNNFQFVFTGHSVGGSIATLAAYDLTRSGVISKTKNKPQVYSFGGLRIGDQRFVTLVNAVVPVYRIIRSDDYIVRAPSCYYSLTSLGWKCFSRPVINTYVVLPSSPLFLYVQNYRYSYFYSVPVFQAIKTYIAFRKRGASISHRKRGINRSFAKHKALPVKSRQPSIRTILKSKLKPIKSETVKTKWHSIKQPSFKFNKRRSLLRPRRRLAFTKKRFTFNRKRPTLKLRTVNRKPLQIRQRRVIRRPTPLRTKPHSLSPLKKLPSLKPLKPSKTTPKKAAKKGLKFKVYQVSPKLKPLKDSKLKPLKSNLRKINNNKQPPKSKLKKNGKEAPIISLNHNSIGNLPKLQITPSAIKTYYNTYVYYTQPFGFLFYYPSTFASFQVCTYVNFVSVCESKILLPSVFTLESHFVYYGIRFDVCSA